MNHLQQGRMVLDYTLRTRSPKHRARFPMTAGWIMQTSRKLGHPIGRNKAYAVQRELLQHDLDPAGSYPQRKLGRLTGFKVSLYALRPCSKRPDGLRTSSVPYARRKQRLRAWWQHGLFGLGVEKYPRDLPKRLKGWGEAWDAPG